uniref:Phosducin domain-containing protein n=1 Tax=Guillardia theta TaxID=55529 RepID=A0A7S4K6A8_GUITH|mmetsp:Transcript_21249/g.70506  ORF Transcript_21249/g.70506 Transcript_21249/m.70506 type:complete len:235 (+) Transcript_21249:131-835(+)
MYHPRKENACYDTTEWDELQKKYGNLDTELGSDRYLKDLEEETRAIGDLLKKQEKEEERRWNQRAMEMGDEDDEADEDEQTFMENYRQRRLEEMKAAAKAAKFGEVYNISADSFRQEVTDAATESLFVVVYLYRDGRADCELVNEMLTEMAKKNPNTKFTRIYYSNAIPNYPEAHLPTILVYHKHDIVKQIVTLREFGGYERMAKPDGKKLLAKALRSVGALQPLEEDEEEDGE